MAERPTLTRELAIRTAHAAAAAVFQVVRPPNGVRLAWYSLADGREPLLASILERLADRLDQFPTCTAESLWRSTEPADCDRIWQSEPALRVAYQVFQATYLPLITEVRLEAKVRAEQVRVQAMPAPMVPRGEDSVFWDDAITGSIFGSIRAPKVARAKGARS